MGHRRAQSADVATSFLPDPRGSGGLPISVSPVEMVLLLTLAAVVLPQVIRRGGTFVRGPLFAPLLLFITLVVASIAYGVAGEGSAAGPFDVKAAWAETRSFFYLGITYVLACNLIQTSGTTAGPLILLFIAAVGIKSVQGVALRRRPRQRIAGRGDHRSRGCGLLCSVRPAARGAAPLQSEIGAGGRRQMLLMPAAAAGAGHLAGDETAPRLRGAGGRAGPGRARPAADPPRPSCASRCRSSPSLPFTPPSSGTAPGC